LRPGRLTISRHDRSHQLPFYDIYIILALAKNGIVLYRCAAKLESWIDAGVHPAGLSAGSRSSRNLRKTRTELIHNQ
jgi:hypothetical protein